MTPVEACRARALSLAAVIAIAGTRGHALAFPQSPTWPAFRILQVGAVEFMHLEGSTQIHRARIQVDTVADVDGAADPYATAHDLMAAIHGDGQGASATGLCGWRGGIGSPPFVITGILPDAGPRDLPYVPEEQRLVRVQRDYFVWFQGP